MALGEILKQKRLERNFTKEYIAERTHMMCATIEALENEDFKKIPAPIYGRGFIKSYCKVLDINPQPLIDEYMTKSDENYLLSKSTAMAPQKPVHTGQHTVQPPKEVSASIPSSVPSNASRLVSAGNASLRPATLPSSDGIPQPIYTRPTPPPPQAPAPEPPMAPEPQPTTTEGEPFVLSGDVIEQPTTPTPKSPKYATQPPETKFHRLVSAQHARAQQQESEIQQEDETQPMEANNSIFGPQYPAQTPTGPIVKLLQIAWKNIKLKFSTTKEKINVLSTKQKIRRIGPNEERPLLSRQNLTHAGIVLGVLISITLIFLLFRWVFQESADSVAPETTPVVKTANTLPIPEPYFTNN